MRIRMISSADIDADIDAISTVSYRLMFVSSHCLFTAVLLVVSLICWSFWPLYRHILIGFIEAEAEVDAYHLVPVLLHSFFIFFILVLIL